MGGVVGGRNKLKRWSGSGLLRARARAGATDGQC